MIVFVVCVQVWMPDYKHIYYDAFPDAKQWGFGDVSEQTAHRQQLGDQCRDFSWFIENVFPDMFVPLKVHEFVRVRDKNSSYNAMVLFVFRRMIRRTQPLLNLVKNSRGSITIADQVIVIVAVCPRT